MSGENQLFLHLVGQILNTECFTSSGRDFFVLPQSRKERTKGCAPNNWIITTARDTHQRTLD
jgi:hypothetical protein